MRLRRTPWLLVVQAAVTLAFAAWGAARWSLIPVSIDDEVVTVRYQSESGYRWRILELADGRQLVIDRRITDQLDDWEHLDGRRAVTTMGSRELAIGDERASLAPSVEFWKVVLTMSGIVVVAITRAARSERARAGSAAATPRAG
ncbi:MAG: hypothetical protein KDA94_01870 [Acidimicrobiales bacterium]|nr:hypothetical protein [Acidimicrobiales bacterium]